MSLSLDEKLFLEALDDKNVVKNAEVRIIQSYSPYKLRAWCDKVSSFLRFPNKLRFSGAKYIVDVVEVKPENKTHFYRPMKGTIRNKTTGQVVG